MSDYIFQFKEIISTSTNNFLIIHKNGSQQVVNHLFENYPQVNSYNSFPVNNLIYWAILRDPLDRFISGLTYDIIKQFQTLDNIDKILNLENVSSFFYNKPKSVPIKQGNLSHTTLQWTYLVNTPIDCFVDIKDLNVFLDMHFQKRINVTETNTLPQLKQQVYDYIKNNPNLKEIIMNYLSPDFFFIKEIKTFNKFWSWQDGKIF